MDFLMVWVKCHHLVQCLISLTQVQEVIPQEVHFRHYEDAYGMVGFD